MSKIKIRHGKDANVSTLRKLLYNLIFFGKVKTTTKRAKVLKASVDSLVYKALQEKSSTTNTLRRNLGNDKAATQLATKIAPQYKGRVGGYVTIKKMGQRLSDGAETSQIEWLRVVKPTPKVEEPVVATPALVQNATSITTELPNKTLKRTTAKKTAIKKTTKKV